MFDDIKKHVRAKKDAMVNPDSLEDVPVPTYQEWLDQNAQAVFSHPLFFALEGCLELVKYLWTRERLLIQLLVMKGVVQEHEVDEYFGDKAHEECEKQGIKQFTKTLMRAASQGKLKDPTGKSIAPDGLLVILNDILDLNDTGWNGKTLEAFEEVFGDGDGGSLKQSYEEEVKLIERLNETRAQARESKARRAEQEKEMRERLREERERRVKIYISQCRIFDRELPSEEDRQKMIDGEMEIPKVA